MTDENVFDNLYSGLQALSNASFPKKCPTCNKIYETVEIYIKETSELATNKSGLIESYDPFDKHNIVELYRNCSCGSTLMDVFNDRRDLSTNGEKRRLIFKKILSTIIKSGMDKEEARLEILKVMNGKTSKKLEEMGIKYKTGKK